MDCPKCGTSLRDDAVFCGQCGKKIGVESSGGLKEKKTIIGLTTGGVLIAVGIWVYLSVGPMNHFKNAVKSNEYTKASDIYHQEIKGDADKEKEALAFVQEQLKGTLADFKSGTLSYDDAKAKLQTIEEIAIDSDEAKKDEQQIDSLQDSRVASKKMKEFIQSKKYADAIQEFKKMIPGDPEYADAQKQIAQIKTDYKQATLKDANAKINQKQYKPALDALNDALTYIQKDPDLEVLQSKAQGLYDTAQAEERKKQMDDYKNKQEVSVVGAQVVRTGTYIDFFYTQVIVQNNSSKVVKNFTVGWLAFDQNGYPVYLNSNSYLDEGNAKAVNIQPGDTFGGDNGWDIYSNQKARQVKNLIACVKEVEYYDGSTWTNPYYPLWTDEYQGKQLH